MRKIKRLVSALLAVFMLLASISCVTYSAEEVTIRDKFRELNEYLIILEMEYNIYYYEEGDPIPDVGDIYLVYEEESEQKLYNDCIAADDIKERYVENKESVTLEDVDALIETIETDLENLYIDRCELEFLLRLADKDNSNGYYDEETWSEFEDIVKRANALLADENADVKQINDVYWELRFKFNEMCAYNQVMGDVDGDGRVTVLDATLLQRAIAEQVELNCSQVFVAAVGGCYPTPVDLNINCVTAIQRYCAEYEGVFDVEGNNQNWPEYLSEYLYTTEVRRSPMMNQMYSMALFYNMQGRFWN